jgi:F-type H+-transporting ATPase subunit gamma
VATLRDIRRRIASVQNTRKITKAMEMVAAAKLRRNQARIEALRPYARDMIEMMEDLATYSQEAHRHALLQEREVRTVAVVTMTGDRGLAGAFNANVVRRAMAIERDLREEKGAETRVLAVGRKGIGTLKFRGCRLEKSWHGLSDRPQYSDAKKIAAELIEMFTSGQVDRVRLVYNHFTSPIEQTLMDDVILPVPQEAFTDTDDGCPPVSYIYEPAPEDILAGLLPAYVEIAVYRALLESSASEQGARMSAMRNASEAAEEMIDSLTLALNRARQAAITQEILEVVAGAEALG